MLISVIVPTCQRPELLSQCLQKLAPGGQSLEADAYQVIVTDDSANATTRDLIAREFPWARWIAGPRHGPAANRNHGARHAGGEWLAFVDDDCEPDTRWLEAIADAIPHGELDVIEGKTICPGRKDNPFQEQVENLNGDLFWSCNLIVRRRAFEQLGGFDEDFAEAGGEDMEFAWRIRQQQLRACFAEKAIVLHPPRHAGWRRLWWRTWMSRWMLLYWIKTEQSPPLEAGPWPVCWKLISRHLLDLVRSTSRLITRFDRRNWRRGLWFSSWKWLTLPVLLPYLLFWEFRFRRKLAHPAEPEAKPHPSLARG